MLLVEIGRTLEQPRSSFAAKRIPADLRSMSSPSHPIDIRFRRLERRSDRDPMVVRRDDRPSFALSKARFRGPAARFEPLQSLEQWLAHQRIAEVDPVAVAALVAEELGGQNDLRV